MLIAAAVLCACGFWFFPGATSDAGEAGRYSDWRRANRTLERVDWYGSWLPQFLLCAFHFGDLERKYVDKSNALEETLIQSGYLTCVSVVTTNSVISLRPTIATLLRKFPRGAIKIRGQSVSVAAVVITCRPQDIEICKTILAEK